MEFLFANEETTQNITVHGDIESYFDETRELYIQAVSLLEQRYNNRNNWLENPIYPELETDIPTPIVDGFVDSYVISPAFYTLSALFSPNTTLEDFADQEENPFTESERYIYLKHAAEDTARYEWVDEQTVVINPYFKIEVPISKSLIDSMYSAHIEFERTDNGSFTTSFSFSLQGQTDTEGMSESCFTKLCSDCPAPDREASVLADCGIAVIMVALGHKPVATTMRPNQLQQLTHFPIDTICWNADENEECDVGSKVSYSDKKAFVFNTETHSRTEMTQLLTKVYESSETNAGKFGRLLGYPEYATKSFERRRENNIAPATDNYIKQLFYLLGTDFSFNKKELEYATYNEYVYDYDNLSKDAKRGQRHKAALINFMDEYNIETSNPDQFRIQKKYPSEVPETFDEFWTYEIE